MTPEHCVRLLDRYHDAGLRGVAFGPKEVDGKSEGNPSAITFFVERKLPLRGAARTLDDGRRRLPKSVQLQGHEVPTDVVVAGGAEPGRSRRRAARDVHRAGTMVSNMQQSGTFGCLTTVADRPGVFALTNQHVGLGPGTAMFFPDARTVGAIVGLTQRSTTLIADEIFLSVIDKPLSYVDVDAALIQIPSNFLDRFSPAIPNFGAPADFFRADNSSEDAYRASLLGLEVFAYAWGSGVRRGVVSHVYYVYRRGHDRIASVACFLVKSTDSLTPGLLGDSGKLWMCKVDGRTLGIGLHSGVVEDEPGGSRFAMATELGALARHYGLGLWQGNV